MTHYLLYHIGSIPVIIPFPDYLSARLFALTSFAFRMFQKTNWIILDHKPDFSLLKW